MDRGRDDPDPGLCFPPYAVFITARLGLAPIVPVCPAGEDIQLLRNVLNIL